LQSETKSHERGRGNRQRTSIALVAALGLALVVGTGCGSNAAGAYGGSSGTGSYSGPIPHQQYGGGHLNGTATGDTERGAAFARWVLEQDPRHEYITDAVVREENTLGVKVQPTVSKRELQQLLTSLAEGMARTFPGKRLTVVAFYQSGDKLAEAHYDPRTNQVDIR